MRPYPRKHVHLLRTDNSNLEQPTRSAAKNISVSEHENQSPTSVLSPVSSDTIGSSDSNTPSSSGSPSTVSLVAGVQNEPINHSEQQPSSEDSRSSLSAVAEDGLFPDKNISVVHSHPVHVCPYFCLKKRIFFYLIIMLVTIVLVYIFRSWSYFPQTMSLPVAI